MRMVHRWKTSRWKKIVFSEGRLVKELWEVCPKG